MFVVRPRFSLSERHHYDARLCHEDVPSRSCFSLGKQPWRYRPGIDDTTDYEGVRDLDCAKELMPH